MKLEQANELYGFIEDFCDDILNKTFDKYHKKPLLAGIKGRLNMIVNQDNQQPQPDKGEIKKIKGEEITPKGLKQNENKE